MMRLQHKWKIAVRIIVYTGVACLVVGALQYRIKGQEGERVWHHRLAQGTDFNIGVDQIPEDYLVQEGFVTHLPLVIIDTGGIEIPNYKKYDDQTDSFIVEEGINPYVEMRMEIIDHENGINTLGDEPTNQSHGRIKIRGNTSSSSEFPKKQYTLKLETEEGEKNPKTLMGMTESDTWILNGTQLDKSYMRNYIAMNIGGELDPYTPDMRYCEVLFRKGDTYEYRGLYILYEKISQGPGRVDILDVSDPPAISDKSYMVLRDRMSQGDYNLSVYSTKFQRENNWISLEYPLENKVTERYWEYIKGDILKIEKALYSDHVKEFIAYREWLDIESFVDYFIINEFFANYDAGWNSTYLYKQADGRVAIGPFWDFDGALDNYKEALLKTDVMVVWEAPWFERLVRDEWFVKQVVSRYRELRETLLGEENLEQIICEVKKFIQKPVQRDVSRWGKLYEGKFSLIEEEDTNLMIDRNVKEWEEETTRIMDTMRMHGDYMDEDITELYALVYVDKRQLTNTVSGCLFILSFFVSVILVQRVRKGA